MIVGDKIATNPKMRCWRYRRLGYLKKDNICPLETSPYCKDDGQSSCGGNKTNITNIVQQTKTQRGGTTTNTLLKCTHTPYGQVGHIKVQCWMKNHN